MSEVEQIPTERPDPNLIQELFDADPLKLSDQNIDTMIAYYRTERFNYMQAPEEKKSKAKAKPALTPEEEAGAKDLLSDLGL